MAIDTFVFEPMIFDYLKKDLKTFILLSKI